MPDELVVQIGRQVAHQRDSDADHVLSLQRRKRTEDPHRAVNYPPVHLSKELPRLKNWNMCAHLDDSITASRMSRSWAMTHSTLRWTPKARRKSHSWRTSSSGGVQAHRVRIAVKWGWSGWSVHKCIMYSEIAYTGTRRVRRRGSSSAGSYTFLDRLSSGSDPQANCSPNKRSAQRLS
jgi:hypothetical protein